MNEGRNRTISPVTAFGGITAFKLPSGKSIGASYITIENKTTSTKSNGGSTHEHTKLEVKFNASSTPPTIVLNAKAGSIGTYVVSIGV